LTVFFAFVRAPSWALGLTLAAAGMDLAFVHPTYALFLALPLVGFALARALLARGRARGVRRARTARVRVARADRLRDPVAQPRPLREGEPARALRERPRRPLPEQLPSRARNGRAQRLDRTRRSRSRPARRPRRSAAVERARPRRDGDRARPRALVARF